MSRKKTLFAKAMHYSLIVTDGPKIRLVDGPRICSGRVEVYYNGQWGTVCDDGWDIKDAAVVCREMGCGTVINAPHKAYFGQGSGPILLVSVSCSGNESSITACSYDGFGKHNCDHDDDAGVTCSGTENVFR